MGHNLWKISRKVNESQSNYRADKNKAYKNSSGFCFGFCCTEVKPEWLACLIIKSGREGERNR